jgi:hypothetical protein
MFALVGCLNLVANIQYGLISNFNSSFNCNLTLHWQVRYILFSIAWTRVKLKWHLAMVAWNQIFLGIEFSSNRLNICSFGASTSRKLWYLVISLRYLMPFSSSSILSTCYGEITTLYTSTYMNSNICLINIRIFVYMVQHRGVALRSVTWCLCVTFPFRLISVIPICFISLLLFYRILMFMRYFSL